MERRRITSFALRFAAIYVALAIVAVVWERPLGEAVAPFVKLGVGLGTDVEVRQISSEGHHLTARVVFTDPRRPVGERRVHATVAANGDLMLVGPLLAISAVAAWAYRSRRERAAAMMLGPLFAFALSAHDAASTITIGIRSKLGVLDPATAFYSFFLDSGGRQLLALAAATLAIRIAGRVGEKTEAAPHRRVRRSSFTVAS
ncbi:MAG TPA: hypothetical protein VH062_09635 [Polyangiaceae bacterium]|jgi:hypothetical protein|nr:hypothetical protein [Polyangiaceae bacterium]